ncbi:phosphodiester glycosidase family protein [Spirosoma luteolum]
MKFLLLFLLSLTLVQAQPTPDSVRVRRAPWHETRLRRGLRWREARIDSLFGSRQNINLIVLKNRRRKPVITFASAGDSLKPTSWFGRQSGALVALNGTFFDVKNGGSVDLIRIDGQLLDTTRRVGRNLIEHQQAAIVIDRNRVRIVFGGDQPGWDRTLPQPNVMTTGPLLLRDGQAHPLKANAFNDNRHPRTCLCLGPRRQLILATVDGRHANAQGMKLHELTRLMQWLGCRDAINLDGGGSTTLWLRQAPESGVVNYPSDSRQWIHTGERPVSNAILIR